MIESASTPSKFILKRMTDYEVIQTFFEGDIEEVIDIFEVKVLINFNFGEVRAKPILEYLYGYYDIIVDLDIKRACVMKMNSSKEEIDAFLKEEIYTLRHLKDGSASYNPREQAWTVNTNGKVYL